MTIEELRSRLREIADRRLKDAEVDHGVADGLLLEFINDPEVTKAYSDIEKWYA